MFVKYCHTRHNALKGTSLLIGNLEKYRYIENKELIDEGEGTFSFWIEFLKGATIPTAWANFIFQGSIGFGGTSPNIRLPGKFNTHIEEVRVNQGGSDFVIFDYAKVKISYSAPNSYIFCLSRSDLAPMSENPFPSYDDYWVVGKNNKELDQFASRVGNLLLSQLKGLHIDGGINELSLSEMKNIDINIRHGPVNYINRELVFFEGTPQNFEQIIQKYLDVPFCKPNSFSKEREGGFKLQVQRLH